VVKGPNVAVTGSVSDAASAGVVVNGVAATVAGNTFTATVPASDGSFTIQATATDAAGNSASADATITVDTAGPVITIVEPANGQYTAATTIDVSGGVNDASSVHISVNGIEATVTGHAFVAAGVVIGNGPSVPIEV